MTTSTRRQSAARAGRTTTGKSAATARMSAASNGRKRTAVTKPGTTRKLSAAGKASAAGRASTAANSSAARRTQNASPAGTTTRKSASTTRTASRRSATATSAGKSAATGRTPAATTGKSAANARDFAATTGKPTVTGRASAATAGKSAGTTGKSATNGRTPAATTRKSAATAPKRGAAASKAVPTPRKPAARTQAGPARRYQLETSYKELTPAERAERGRKLRADVPRSSHAGFAPASGRPDPVALLQAQSATRLPDLVPIRYGRMLVSPFSYFRGAALPMAHDLSTTPVTGIAVQACGDAHLGNFGLFGTAERRLVFDINDFDETLPGPWEWDVKRLAASLEIAARDNGMGKRARSAIVRAAVSRYRLAMSEFAGQTNLQVFYARADVEEVNRRLRDRLTAKQRSKLTKGTEKAMTRDSMQALDKLCRVVDGRPQIVADPPIVVPLSSLLTDDIDPSRIEKMLVRVVDDYKRTLPGDRAYLLGQYRNDLADVARKVVGVGSVGTRCWIMLMLGRDSSDPLFLQMKEAGESVLSEFAGRSRYQNQGQRVVEGQRLMQAASDIFLGWQRLNPAPDGQVRDFYIRQLRDWKMSLDPQTMTEKGLSDYGEVCGWTLARAHARTGDRIAIAAYLGTSDAFDRAIAEFATAYADQNERDYAALEEAATSGRVLAQRGV